MRIEAVKHGNPACVPQIAPLFINAKIHTDKTAARHKFCSAAKQDALPIISGLFGELRTLTCIGAHHMNMV